MQDLDFRQGLYIYKKKIEILNLDQPLGNTHFFLQLFASADKPQLQCTYVLDRRAKKTADSYRFRKIHLFFPCFSNGIMSIILSC